MRSTRVLCLSLFLFTGILGCTGRIDNHDSGPLLDGNGNVEPDDSSSTNSDPGFQADPGTEDAGADAGSDRGADEAGEDAGADAGADLGGPDAGGDDPNPSIWHPQPGTSWQWQITGTLDTSVDVAMYDLDLFETPQATIDQLHQDGRMVICYFSAGSREDWRPDADQFAAADIGSPLDGWEGENWINIKSTAVRDIMKARLDLAVSKHCDGVEPDNVDGYSNSNGLGLKAADQLDYNRFLATEAHTRGLSIGLKNDIDQVETLEPAFDWALNEECLAYDECGALAAFISAGKAVFHVEYAGSTAQGQTKASQVCGDSTIEGFSTLIKLLDLDAWRIACP